MKKLSRDEKIEIARRGYKKAVESGELTSYRATLDFFRRVIEYSEIEETEKKTKLIELALDIVEGYSENFDSDSAGSVLPLIVESDREILKNGNYEKAIEIILEEINGEYLL